MKCSFTPASGHHNSRWHLYNNQRSSQYQVRAIRKGFSVSLKKNLPSDVPSGCLGLISFALREIWE